MDALEIIKQINNYKKKVENMDYINTGNKPVEETNQLTTENNNMITIGTVISNIIGLYAAYLSYDCNTKKNISEIAKIIFAIFAYIFGLFYLMYYYLFQYDTCNSL
jgi:predicted PurR-regulated permease PerM